MREMIRTITNKSLGKMILFAIALGGVLQLSSLPALGAETPKLPGTPADEPRKEYRAEMSCNVYKIRVEAKQLKESTLIFSGKGQPFTIGYTQVSKTPLPEPYQNISVKFEHYTSYYKETGASTSTPFVVANFIVNNEDKAGSRTNFDFVNPEAGTKVLLRNTINYDPETILTYQCALTVVK